MYISNRIEFCAAMIASAICANAASPVFNQEQAFEDFWSTAPQYLIAERLHRAVGRTVASVPESERPACAGTQKDA